MKSGIRVICFTIPFLAIIFSTSYAQNQPISVKVSTGLGMNLPAGDFSKEKVGAASSSYSITAKGVMLYRNIIGIYVSYSPNNFNTSFDPIAQGIDKIFWRINNFSFGCRCTLPIKIKSYAQIGCGIYKAAAHTEGVLPEFYGYYGTTYVESDKKQHIDIVDKSNTNLGVQIGLGIT